jgi:hypothetical protein
VNFNKLLWTVKYYSFNPFNHLIIQNFFLAHELIKAGRWEESSRDPHLDQLKKLTTVISGMVQAQPGINGRPYLKNYLQQKGLRVWLKWCNAFLTSTRP